MLYEHMTKLLVHETRRLADNEIVDIIVWAIPVTKEDPDGVSYSINYRKFDENKGRWMALARFDNAHKYKGHKTKHHLHIGHIITEVRFKNIGELYPELLTIIDRLKKEGENEEITEENEWSK